LVNQTLLIFQNQYLPDELLVEFTVPLDDYLFLLAKSSGYNYKSGEGELKCDPITIPFHTNRHNLTSKSELKTVYDHLEQLSFTLPEKYAIEIHEPEKSIKLTCIIEY
jgi:hypothetical protein